MSSGGLKLSAIFVIALAAPVLPSPHPPRAAAGNPDVTPPKAGSARRNRSSNQNRRVQLNSTLRAGSR